MMPDLLQPDKNSRENIQLFLDSIEDADIRRLLNDHLADILAAGSGREGQTSRRGFFASVNAIIDRRLGEQP